MGKPGLLKELNASVLLDVIRDEGPLTRPDLARLTGLSLPTVNARVRRLLQAGYVREAGRAKSRGGRRAWLLEFNGRFGYVAGIDVGGDTRFRRRWRISPGSWCLSSDILWGSG